MSTNYAQTLVVTGAAGKLGRRVIEFLLDANAGQIVAATRAPAKLADLAGRGVDVRYADFDHPDTLTAAFTGVDRLLLISTDALDRRIQQQRNAIAAAQQAGVKHVVYTSIVRPEASIPLVVAASHYDTEQALADSALDWTILRNSIYTDMFLQSLPRAVASGRLVAAAGAGAVAYVTREDCARVAAAVLAAQSTGRTTLEITGPALVTHTELAQTLSVITGRTVTYTPVEPDVIFAGMVAAGLPEPIARIFASFDSAIAEGSLAALSNAVADVTGQASQSVQDFLAPHRAVLLGDAA